MYCRYCGNEVSDSAAYCSNCGKPVDQVTVYYSAEKTGQPSNAAAPAPAARKRGRPIVTLLIIVAIIAIVGSCGRGGGSSSSRSSGERDPLPTKDEIREGAVDATYNNLLRNPDRYEGKYFCARVEIKQALGSGKRAYYRACTEDSEGSGYFYGDEFVLIDGREDGAVKIVPDDVMTVYGRYAGVKTVTRALTRTDEEVPVVEILYADIENLD